MYDDGNEAGEERVRSHSVRVAILALLARDRGELTAVQIQAELPGCPALRSIYYHLAILQASRLVVEDGGCYKLA
jgi:predicted transcriptional regulator